jgi:hypothetical protein
MILILLDLKKYYENIFLFSSHKKLNFIKSFRTNGANDIRGVDESR